MGNEQMPEKPKPCPYCGGRDISIGGNYVLCRDCGGSSHVLSSECMGDEQGLALRRWNRRAAPEKP